MPINLQDELARSQLGTNRYLAGITPQLLESQNRARETLAKARGRIFANLGLDPRAIPRVSGGLISEAERTLSRQRLGVNRERINLIYETARKRAELAGAEKDEAEQYARQVATQRLRQEAESTELQEELKSRRYREDLADLYADRGLALSEQYAPRSNYETALIQSLAALGGSAGTVAALNYADRPRQVRQPVSSETLAKYRSQFYQPSFRSDFVYPSYYRQDRTYASTL